MVATPTRSRKLILHSAGGCTVPFANEVRSCPKSEYITAQYGTTVAGQRLPSLCKAITRSGRPIYIQVHTPVSKFSRGVRVGTCGRFSSPLFSVVSVPLPLRWRRRDLNSGRLSLAIPFEAARLLLRRQRTMHLQRIILRALISNKHGAATLCLRDTNSRSVSNDVLSVGAECDSVQSARPFEDIPGPKSYPVVGTLLNYLPIFGQYDFDRLPRNGMKKFHEFGPLVREEIVPGVNIVWVFAPQDIETVFRYEGRFPYRRSHLAVEKYRKDRSDLYDSGGLLPTNGEKWYELRHTFQKALSRPQNVRLYVEESDKILTKFLNIVRGKVGMPAGDFLPLLSHLFLELVSLVAFDAELHGLSEAGMQPNSLASQLIEAAETVSGCVVSLDNGLQLWRWFETPLYKKMKKAHQTMENVAVDLVSQKKALIDLEGIPKDRQPSLLEIYLSNSDISVKDIVGMAVDMILAGMDTTSFSTSFALYHLATNPDIQKALHKECCELLPDKDSPITSAILDKAHYTKAVVKESLRLNPVSVGVGRILPQDVVLAGYRVPQGTNIVTQNQITCRLPDYFPNPNDFIPERWIKTHPLFQKPHPYLLLPFGHGPRSCIARRLAEQNMHLLLLKLCRNFEVAWCGDTLDCRSLPNKPDNPVLLSFKSYD